MAVLVVNGGGRGVGKTAVACALMAALPELRWLAAKVTPHSHGLQDKVWAELDRESEKDTGRYLRAGARRAFLLKGNDYACEMVKMVRSIASDCDSVLVESNHVTADAIAKSHEPIVSIAVVSEDEQNWKPSLFEAAGQIDVLVLTGGFPRRSPEVFAANHVFLLGAGEWVTAELIDFIRNKLLPHTAEGWL